MKTKGTGQTDVDKLTRAMAGKRDEGRRCPNCKSLHTCRDSPGTWLFFFSLLLFPISLLLLLLNRNRFCLNCGVRFKKLT